MTECCLTGVDLVNQAWLVQEIETNLLNLMSSSPFTPLPVLPILSRNLQDKYFSPPFPPLALNQHALRALWWLLMPHKPTTSSIPPFLPPPSACFLQEPWLLMKTTARSRQVSLLFKLSSQKWQVCTWNWVGKPTTSSIPPFLPPCLEA